MCIAIFGAGGTGALLGGLLTQSGEEVCVIVRGENLLEIRDNGLKIERAKGNFVARPALATGNPAEVG